jgi:hypothetical protein
MQLSPYTTAFFAVFFDFPFAFTKDLQPGGINHQMRDFTSGERFETDINRLCALADTGVIRAAQRNIHQCKMESIKPCAARRVNLNTRLMTRTVVMARS